MVNRLKSTRSLTSVDDAVLYQYVCLFVEVEEQKAESTRLDRLSRNLEELVTAKLEGQARLDALDKIRSLRNLKWRAAVNLRQGRLALRQYLVEFGMTPGSRTRVKASPPEAPSTTRSTSRFFNQ
jgi:hypothetical protein